MTDGHHPAAPAAPVAPVDSRGSPGPVREPVNVRDLGGLPLRQGGSTASGVLLRGDALYDGDGPPTTVPWPPETVIDLRSQAERSRSPYRWPATTRVVGRDLFDAADLGARRRPASLTALYTEMVTLGAARIATLVDLLAESGATYLHCAAGKDRTGAAVAALLALADVAEEAIVADYVATARNVDAVVDRMRARGALPREPEAPWIDAPPAAIRVVLDALAGHAGGPRGWFRAHGASAAALERYLARITEGTASTHARRDPGLTPA